MAINGANLGMGAVAVGAAAYALPALGFFSAAGVGFMTFGGMKGVQHIVRRHFFPEEIVDNAAEVFQREVVRPFATGSAMFAYDKFVLDKRNIEFVETRECVGIIECGVRLFAYMVINGSTALP